MYRAEDMAAMTTATMAMTTTEYAGKAGRHMKTRYAETPHTVIRTQERLKEGSEPPSVDRDLGIYSQGNLPLSGVQDVTSPSDETLAGWILSKCSRGRVNSDGIWTSLANHPAGSTGS